MYFFTPTGYVCYCSTRVWPLLGLTLVYNNIEVVTPTYWFYNDRSHLDLV